MPWSAPFANNSQFDRFGDESTDYETFPSENQPQPAAAIPRAMTRGIRLRHGLLISPGALWNIILSKTGFRCMIFAVLYMFALAVDAFPKPRSRDERKRKYGKSRRR
jgi:hypothetical protein